MAPRHLWHRACFPVDAAAVALGNIALHFAWQAWHLATWTSTLRGKCGTWRHRPPLCMAGVALMALDGLRWRTWFPVDAVVAAAVGVAGLALSDIAFHFAWQAWHLATSTSTLRGRRGTYAATPWVPRLFVWQAWHLATSTVTLRGRRGTYGTGLALGSRLAPWAPRHFAWQAWHLVIWTCTLRGRW